MNNFPGSMRKIKGPLKTVYNDIQMEIDDLEVIIRSRYYQINNLINDPTIDPAGKANMLSESFTALRYFKNQLKILKEKEIIISCVWFYIFRNEP